MEDPNKKEGLKSNYAVIRKVDPTHKHDKCFFFVLDLDHDKFAIPALNAYIQSCNAEYPLLAADLKALVEARQKKK